MEIDKKMEDDARNEITKMVLDKWSDYIKEATQNKEKDMQKIMEPQIEITVDSIIESQCKE